MAEHQPQAGVLFGYVMVLLLLPKALGLWHAWSLSDQVKAFRKRGKLLLSVILETLFSMILAPILMLFYTKFVLSALTGHDGKMEPAKPRGRATELERVVGHPWHPDCASLGLFGYNGSCVSGPGALAARSWEV